MGRDKELSEFTDHTVALSARYEILAKGWRYMDKATLNLRYQRIWFDYDNFSDVRDGQLPGFGASTYDFDADVLQVFASVWF